MRLSLSAAVAFVCLTLAAPYAPAQDAKRYAAIDAHALKTPPEAEESLDKLAEYLAKPAKDDNEKARAVFLWVTDRIAYDVEDLVARRGDNTPEGVLKRRKALCGGYADLYKDLCGRAGVKAVTVLGDCKGDARPNQIELHAWNAVLLGEQWRLVDPTWGAGPVIENKFKKARRDTFFLADPEQLSFTHRPKEEKYQLLKEPFTQEQFEALPLVKHDLFEVGFTPARIRKAIGEEGVREFVMTREHPSKSTTVVTAPLSKKLKVGTAYPVEIKSGDYVDILVTAGGKFGYFTRQGTTFKTTVRPAKGVVQIAGKRAGEKEYFVILEYEAE